MPENIETTSSQQKPKMRNFQTIIGLALLSLVFGGLGSFLFDKYLQTELVSRGVLNGGDDQVVVRELQPISVVENDAVVETVAAVESAVVSIISRGETRNFFNEELENISSGSGFIVTEDGFIATNKHVVEGATSVSVLTEDGKEFEANIVDIDPLSDFAMLKVEATGLPVVNLGFSDEVQVGESVVAIGNALGAYDNTVTTGIISGKNRTIVAGSQGEGARLEGLLQIDAAINQGNSGGPLTNLSGQVIGINTAVDRAGEGIGFAIPINDVRPAIDSVLAEGRIIRPLLGVRYINITPEFASLNDLPVEQGALLVDGEGTLESAVIAGGPADEAGLSSGDIILAINDDEITLDSSLVRLLQKHKPSESVNVRYLDGGEEEKSVEVVLGEAS